jgi:hypothetical protein
LANLEYLVSDQTVGNILRRRGIAPVPERSKTTTWKDFIHRHMDVLAATDFFTVELLTWRGLVTYDPATPKPRLSDRTTGPSKRQPSTSAVIFDPGITSLPCYDGLDEFSVRSSWARPAPALGRKQQTVLLFPQQAVEMH